MGKSKFGVLTRVNTREQPNSRGKEAQICGIRGFLVAGDSLVW